VGAGADVSAIDLENRALELVRSIKAMVNIPVAVKLSPYYTSLAHFARQLDSAGADGLVLFNRLFQPEIDVDALEGKRSLQLSHRSELPLRLRWLGILSPQFKGWLSVTGCVYTASDAVWSIMSGAHTVQIVYALLK